MPKEVQEHITVQEMADALNERFTTYAFMSLEERALPDARDGLKPSQRRVLLAMHDLGLSSKAATEKCAKICGDTSGNYHPHGEAIIYPTMVRLAQCWNLRDTLIQGQGNFGNRDGDPPAAMRYTEAKLSPVGEAMLDDLSEDVVPYVANYNEKRQEPTVLPAMFPNLLVNGGSGIAVGWAFNMPPHNLKEVVEVIKAYIAKPDITPEEVIKIMPGPDFPTAGKILGIDGILDYYRTGRGSVELEGAYDVKTNSRGQQTIVVTELPYGASAEQLVEEINKLVEDEKIDGIVDLQNHSNKDGMCVEISLARNANSALVVNGLLRHTSLRKTFSVNQTVLIDGKVFPDVNILQLLKAFVDHRKDVLARKFEAELRRIQARIHIINGLMMAANKLDDVVIICRKAENPEAAAKALIAAKIVTTMEQANAVGALSLFQLTKLEASKFENELKTKQERVGWLNKVLADNKEILNLVTEEQTELARKFGTDRLTKVQRRAGATIETEDLIKNEQLLVTLSGEGYIKAMPSDSFKTQGRGGKGVIGTNENSDIYMMFESGSKELVLFFTNKGSMYRRKAYEIPEGSRTSKGTHVSNLLSLGEDEVVTSMIPLKSMEEKGYLTIATRKGIIKRTEIVEYNTSLKSAGLVAIRLNDDDQVAFAMVTDGKQEIFICTKNGLCVRYNENVIPVQGRATQGSRALKLDDDDSIAQVFNLDKGSASKILVVTSAGNAKRTNIEDIRSYDSRQVKGIGILKASAVAKQGGIAGACALSGGDGLLVVTTKGKVIRIDTDGIRETGRTATGVCVVTMEDGDTVSKIARLTKAVEEKAE
jgi:DNA gyrase subunit A